MALTEQRAIMRVCVVTEGSPDRVSGGSLYHRALAEAAPTHGAAVNFVSVPSRLFPLAVADGPRVLRAAFDGADVVVVDSLASNTLGPWLALYDRPCAVVGSVHQVPGGSDTGFLRRRLQGCFDRLAWSACTHIVAPSTLLADTLVGQGVPRAAITVIAPGCDLPLFRGRAPDLRDGRAMAVLCVANWLARKGIAELLEAIAGMADHEVTLHLVGDETVDPRYTRRVRSLTNRPDLRRRVISHGVLGPDAVARLYAGADVFAMASSEEPFGIVYGEAMRAGLPVVGWAAGNLPNLVDDGVEGRTVAVGDVDALRRALQALAADPPARRAMGAAAARRGALLATWDDTAAQFFDLCRGLADDAGRGSAPAGRLGTVNPSPSPPGRVGKRGTDARPGWW